MDPRSGLMVFTEVAGENVVLPFWGGSAATGRCRIHNPAEDPEPNVDSFYTIKEIHLTIDRMSVRRNGRRVPVPRRSDQVRREVGRATTTNEFYGGEPDYREAQDPLRGRVAATRQN